MSKKPKMIRIADPVYKIHLSLFWGHSEDVFVSALKHEGIEAEKHESMARTVVSKRISAMWISPEAAFGKDPFPYVAHEINHLVLDGLDLRGVPINAHNAEVMAYLTEFFTREILKKAPLKV